MSGLSALTNAIAGIEVTKARIDTVTRNISNAQTDGYNVRTQGQTVDATGIVAALPVQRVVNQGMQRLLLTSNGTVSSLTTTVNLMQSVTSLFGTPDAATTLSAKITGLQTAYQTLASSPDKIAIQQSALSAANVVASGFNRLTTGITNAINSATAQLNAGVSDANSTLTQIAKANVEILHLTGSSTDVTDLQDQLDGLLTKLSNSMGFNAFVRSDGTMAVYTPQGQALVDGGTAATIGFNAANQLQVTMPGNPPAALTVASGSLGALQTAQNTTFPQYQAQIDEIAAQLTKQFQGIGVPLFTDGGQTFNPANQTGFAGRINVNPAFTAKPSLLRDGNSPVPLAAGDTTNINAALAIFTNNTIAFTTAGLPPTGTIAQAAANFVAGAAMTGQQAANNLTQETAVQQSLKNQISSQSGVNVDQQVAQLTLLQEAYSANARMIQAARDMFTTLLSATGQ